MPAGNELAEDRKWRRQVRKAYYLRRPNFDSTPQYDDYLEEFEVLVEELVGESTRPQAKERLDRLREQWGRETAENHTQHDAEVRKREQAIEQERTAAEEARAERQEAQQRAAEAAEQARLERQNKISDGTMTVQAALDERRAQAAAHRQQQQQPQQQQPQQQQPPGGFASYVPSQQQAEQPPPIAQPLDAAAAAEKAKSLQGMQGGSIMVKRDAYENDPVELKKIQLAAGYQPRLWLTRYSREALCSEAIGWHFEAG